ncbi:MAG: hypothetical protein OEY56_07580 [Cyclobacteriaceae bacterium]|nr:hypothetical protein [Cyclobacteriaceae bacterium]
MDKQKEIEQQMQHDQAEAGSLQSYQQLFDLLEQPPTYSLSENFATGIIKQVDAREKKTYRWFWFWMVSGIVLILTVTLFTCIYLFGVEQIMVYADLTTWAVVAGSLVVAIQYLDYFLIRRHSTFSM